MTLVEKVFTHETISVSNHYNCKINFMQAFLRSATQNPYSQISPAAVMAAQLTLGTFATLPPELREHIWRYVVDDIPPATDPTISIVWKIPLSYCSKQIQEEVRANITRYPLDLTLLHVQAPADLTPQILSQKPDFSLDSKSSGLCGVYAFPRHLELQLFNAQYHDSNLPYDTGYCASIATLSAWKIAFVHFPVRNFHTLTLNLNLT
jgi:hypothetical protein